MEYSYRFILARKRFIELCEQFYDGSPKQTVELGRLWEKWTKYDNGSGDVVTAKVLEFSQKLHTKVQ